MATQQQASICLPFHSAGARKAIRPSHQWRKLVRAAAMTLALYVSTALLSATPNYDAMAKDARDLIGKLIAADTTNPPGNEAKAVAIGAAKLKAAGLSFKAYDFAPGRQDLVARLKGDGTLKPLLLLAHIDVVGATGQTWSTQPHVLTEKDGYLVGRGVNDDLGMASINMEVFLALAKARTPLKRDVILAWTGDEESGGTGIRWLLEHERSAVDAVTAFNEGGGLMLGDDGKVLLASLQEAEKSYQDFELSAQGTTGHSSVPLPDNAIYCLARALDRLGQFRFPPRLLSVTRAYFEQRAGVEKDPKMAGALRALAAAKGALPKEALDQIDTDAVLGSNLRTTCVATTLSGGTRVNALPADAKANINCRILPDESADDVRKQLAQVIGDPRVEIRPVSEFGKAGESPVEGEAPAAVKKIVSQMWPGVAVSPFISRGATDSRYLRAAGIAAYGMDPMPVSESEGRRTHGVDERIPVTSLRTGVEFLHRLVLELAAK
jgi:acetylornithine deacetylase/succinyl-diaminopimelate desuccinylase-like protein